MKISFLFKLHFKQAIHNFLRISKSFFRRNIKILYPLWKMHFAVLIKIILFTCLLKPTFHFGVKRKKEAMKHIFLRMTNNEGSTTTKKINQAIAYYMVSCVLCNLQKMSKHLTNVSIYSKYPYTNEHYLNCNYLP